MGQHAWHMLEQALMGISSAGHRAQEERHGQAERSTGEQMDRKLQMTLWVDGRTGGRLGGPRCREGGMVGRAS